MILSEIMAWARGAGSKNGDGDGQQQRIFWLDGMAGTGKSTIARTIARRCSDEGRLGASFFFSRGGGELETARMFVTTLAVQLARRHKLLQASIYDDMREHPDIVTQILNDQ
jgi:MoxR-like ATPase